MTEEKNKFLFLKIDKYIKKIYKVFRKINKEKKYIFGVEYNNKKLRDKLVSQKKELENVVRKYEILLNESNSNKKDVIKISESNEESSLLDGYVKDYKKMYDLMINSEVFDDLMKGFGVKGSSGKSKIESMICFVRMIGNGVTFADILYVYLEQKRVCLGESERNIIDAVNFYYKKTYALSYEVLLFPNQGIDSKFDKSIMKDINVRNGVFKEYTDVYTPAVMRDSKKIEKRALVKGK